VTRTDSSLLYRGESRQTPEQVFASGLRSEGDPRNVDLWEYVQYGNDPKADKGYLSATRSLAFAAGWRRDGWVYAVVTDGGFDVLDTAQRHGLRYDFPEQEGDKDARSALSPVM
jgi:hypothetical protein